MRNFDVIREEGSFTLRRKTKLKNLSVWWFRGYGFALLLLFLMIAGTLKEEPPREHSGLTLLSLFYLFGLVTIAISRTLMDHDRLRGRLRVKQEVRFDLKPCGRVTIDNDPRQTFPTHRLWRSVLAQYGQRGSTVTTLHQCDLVITAGERAYVLEELENDDELETFREAFITHQGDAATISKRYAEDDWADSHFFLPLVLILSFGLGLAGMMHGPQPPVFHVLSGALCVWSSLFFLNCIVASRSPKKLQRMYGDDVLREVKPVYRAFWINPWLAFLLTAGIHVAYYMLAIRGRWG